MKPVVAVPGSEKVPDLSGAGGEDELPELMGSRSLSEIMLPVSGTGTRTGWLHSPKEINAFIPQQQTLQPLVPSRLPQMQRASTNVIMI